MKAIRTTMARSTHTRSKIIAMAQFLSNPNIPNTAAQQQPLLTAAIFSSCTMAPAIVQTAATVPPAGPIAEINAQAPVVIVSHHGPRLDLPCKSPRLEQPCPLTDQPPCPSCHTTLWRDLAIPHVVSRLDLKPIITVSLPSMVEPPITVDS
ncbi:hypothetical protein L3X38_032891 [Prunus dulcis]|uniref:Uncharacterized protein n=1 Tax=Prunus dulcis TaxID=3755 RepID=A0AAD4VG23_PRUDU|nr:hypothetical protein L3X38_032891 [Prunus dulcis]